MLTNPHHNAHDGLPTRSPKRKRQSESDVVPVMLQPSRLQTTGFEILPSRRVGDAVVEDHISPRTAVSARFQGLNLQNNSGGPTKIERRLSQDMSQRRGSEEGRGSEPEYSSERALGVEKVSEAGSTCVDIDETRGEARRDAKHDIEQAIFEFTAGSQVIIPCQRESHQSPSKHAKFATFESVSNELSTPSPSKRRRQNSTPPPQSQSPVTIPSSQSPSGRNLPNDKQRISESSNDEDPDDEPNEAELSKHWWQPSEITGYDSADPEEDNRGVNGIGYQKSKAEAYKIGQAKRKQLSEWRNREAKEARALRAGGRRTLTGRVVKSRSGSPIEVRGRSSPVPMTLSIGSATIAQESSPKRSVRFEVG